MAEFRRIVTSSFLMLQVLSFRAASVEYSSFIIRDGDEVTLPCGNVKPDQDKCDRTMWLFFGSVNTVTLFESGKIHKEVEDNSDRLSVSEKCSLVIKKVTDEDAGRYYCRQEGGDTLSYLSVVNMTEQKDDDEVTLNCTVYSYGGCRHTVKWMNEGNQSDVVTSQLTCSASLMIKKSHLDQKSNSYELLKCEVTQGYSGEVHQFPFSPPQSSGWWGWSLIFVSVGVAALLIITVAVLTWKRTKGNKTKTDDNVADPEEGVSYASVSYTKKTGGEAQARIQHDDEDEDDSVTYSTVNPPSSSAAASFDPSDLYARVNKPNK